MLTYSNSHCAIEIDMTMPLSLKKNDIWHQPNEFPRKQKNVALEEFLE